MNISLGLGLRTFRHDCSQRFQQNTAGAHDGVFPLHVPNEGHESEVHVLLHVTMQQRVAGINTIC
jgi:hypothetical protein